MTADKDDIDYGDLDDYNADAQEVLMESRETGLETLEKRGGFVRNDYKEFYALCQILHE